jgi:hypothetical protein
MTNLNIFFQLSQALSIYGDDSPLYALRGIRGAASAIRDKNVKKLKELIKTSDINLIIKKHIIAEISQLINRPDSWGSGIEGGYIRKVESKNDVIEITIEKDKFRTFLLKYFDMGQLYFNNFKEQYKSQNENEFEQEGKVFLKLIYVDLDEDKVE